jgi:hypothetical protein
MDDGELEAANKILSDRRNAVPEDILLISRRHTFRRAAKFQRKACFLVRWWPALTTIPLSAPWHKLHIGLNCSAIRRLG